MRYRLMATYRGVPYEAGAGPASAEVVLFAACPPPEELGFEPAPGHWRKRVLRAEIDALWESRPVGIFHGEPCIVLDDLGDRLHIAYLGTDAARAAALGYWQVDRGVFELLTPREEITGLAEERVERPIRWNTPPPDTGPVPAYPYGTAPWPAQPPQSPPPGPAAGPATGAFPVPPGADGGFPPGGAASPNGAAPLNDGGLPSSSAPFNGGGLPNSSAPFNGGGLPNSSAPFSGGGLPSSSAPFNGAAWPESGAGWPAPGPGDIPGPGPQAPGTQLPGSPATGAQPLDGPAAYPPVPGLPPGAPAADLPASGRQAAGLPVPPLPRREPAPYPGRVPRDSAPSPLLPPPRENTGSHPVLSPRENTGSHAVPLARAVAAGQAAAQAAAAAQPAAGSREGGGRSARRQRVTTRSIFCELADLAAIPRHAYALEEETDGAMCLLPTGNGYEVFMAADGARHEVRSFADEEAAYFYLFGVLAAEAIRSGGLAPQ